MAIRHKSAIKRARQSIKRHQRNREVLSRVRSSLKKVRAAIEQKNTEAASTCLRQATSDLHKAVTKGTLKRNTASRWVSRLASRINKM